MMKTNLLLILLSCLCISCKDVNTDTWKAVSPAGSETATSVFLLWNKVRGTTVYRVSYNDNTQVCNVDRTYLSVKGLQPETKYRFVITPLDSAGVPLQKGAVIDVKTKAKGRILNVRDYGVESGEGIINTSAFQKAINECPKGGMVYIPAGIYYSGALFLKSDMTLYLEKGAVLQGTTRLSDYPVIPNRFEGWEISTPAALLNAGTIDRSKGYQLRNLSIRGEGIIRGGGEILTSKMIEHAGERNMGRLICVMNGENITIEGITIEESPCWTVHCIYCKNILCYDLTINSSVIRGDGIDPDSSSDCYIYNCTFSNGDDCIAIKSGKNPEGNIIGIPTRNIRIIDCKFVKGHGISIGSEMSGGVSDILIQDCYAGDLLNGLQIKAIPQRGGYVENIRVEDCSIQKIKLFTHLNYNNDGKAADELPIFRNMDFINLDMTGAIPGQTLIEINGFESPEHYTRNILFKNVLLPDGSTVMIRHCSHLAFDDVLTQSGQKPEYEVVESNEIIN